MWQNRRDQNNEELKINRSVLKIYPFFLKQYHEETRSAWQAFMAFLAVHTIFLGFLLTSFFKENYHSFENKELVSTIAGIAGFLLCLLWLNAFLRYRNVVRFRMAQAKNLEFWEGPGLFRGEGEAFSMGKPILLNGQPYTIGRFLRVPLTNFAYPAIIAIFALTYLFIVLRSWLEPRALLIVMVSIIGMVIGLFISLLICSFIAMRLTKDHRISVDKSSSCLGTEICFIPIALMLVALILHVLLFPFLTLRNSQKRKE